MHWPHWRLAFVIYGGNSLNISGKVYFRLPVKSVNATHALNRSAGVSYLRVLQVLLPMGMKAGVDCV
jgi:hypothetical protein